MGVQVQAVRSEREELTRQHAEDRLHLWITLEPDDLLTAHAVLEATPATAFIVVSPVLAGCSQGPSTT